MTQYTGDGVVTPLRARGYAVLPAPRQVLLHEGSVRIDGSWRLLTSGVSPDDIAVRTLTTVLLDEYGVELASDQAASTLHLSVHPRAVVADGDPLCEPQGYLLEILPGHIELMGNSPQGLFYGVQTLVQLLEGDGHRPLVLPVGTIRDWPRYPLRIVHWDTKHHQDRLETLQRFIDWLAHFKINAVSFELEDKFEYPSHPVIGAPGAFTTAEIQELTRYALERHIQIIPNVQAPAHMCYVLKHPEFAHLRCDGSNYQACIENPEALRLIFDMYDDACAATPGVEYFHVSTDEYYYAGICEKGRRPYNPLNRSLTFVDFVLKAHEHLKARGRRVIIWAEFPLMAEHVHLLPPDIIDGVIGGGDRFVREENARGIRQLAYASMQGEELLFPNYFSTSHEHGGGGSALGRLVDAVEACTAGKALQGNPIGTFAAAWDDPGLHNETFWLGWATMAQYGWTGPAAAPPPAATAHTAFPPLAQTVADFMDIFYGREVRDMAGVYQEMQSAARFFQSIWDRVPSTVRPPAYGWHLRKEPVQRRDLTLSPPALPDGESLAVAPVYSTRYAHLLAEAPRRLAQIERLMASLHENHRRARRNRYGLEVFLSLAHLERHTIEMLLAMRRIEQTLVRAREAHEKNRFARALARLREALDTARDVINDRRRVLRLLESVWEISRFPRNRSVEGRTFLHVMDDVKDHFADRRADLSYLTAPEESMGLEQWCGSLERIMERYASAHGLKENLSISHPEPEYE